jgi:pre-rRNA-processing protein IPI1
VMIFSQSKLVVLRSLSSFIRIALASIDDNTSRLKGRASVSSNTVLDVSFMRNAFPSMEAYYSFEALLEPSCEAINRKGVLHVWQPDVSSDNEIGEMFTPLFPLLDNSSGEPWTLAELSEINDVIGTAKGLDNSRTASADFAAVSILCGPLVFTLNLDCISVSPAHYILQSLKPILTVHLPCSHRVRSPGKQM